MRIHYTLCLLSLVSSSVLAAETLPIDRGTWVREGYACHDAPFAAMFSYDGQSISGPHSSRCETSVVAQAGTTYDVSTTCRGLGDGTPDAPFTEAERFTVESATRVEFAHRQDRAEYRWCGA